MIDAYNAGSLNTEELFRQQVDFAKNLDKEEKHAIEEQLAGEEPAVFDMLTKPNIRLMKKRGKGLRQQRKCCLKS